MPSAPEFGCGLRKIRGIEVFHEVDIHYFSSTDRYIGITREVTVYLEGKAEYTDNESEAAEFLNVIENSVRYPRKAIGDNDLLEHTPKHITPADGEVFRFKRVLCLELIHKVRVTLDRTRNKLREKHKEERKIYKVFFDLYLLVIGIYKISHTLEGAERDTYRNDELGQIDRFEIYHSAEEVDGISDNTEIFINDEYA